MSDTTKAEEMLAERDAEIERLKAFMNSVSEAHGKTHETYREGNRNLVAKIGKLESLIQKKDDEVARLNGVNREFDERTKGICLLLEDREKRIAELESQLQDCAAERDKALGRLDDFKSTVLERCVLPVQPGRKFGSVTEKLVDLNRRLAEELEADNDRLTAKVSDLESQLAMSKETAIIDEARWLEERNGAVEECCRKLLAYDGSGKFGGELVQEVADKLLAGGKC